MRGRAAGWDGKAETGQRRAGMARRRRVGIRGGDGQGGMARRRRVGIRGGYGAEK